MEEMLEATQSWQDSGFNIFTGGDLRRMGISAATVAASEPSSATTISSGTRVCTASAASSRRRWSGRL